MVGLLFCALWIMGFLRDHLGFIAMYGASSYYFSSEGHMAEGQAQVVDGLKLATWTHAGSIALGSGV